MSTTDVFAIESISGTSLFSVDASGNVTAAGTITTTGTDDFGTNGIKADVVAESTSAAGVAVDGMPIKDGGLTIIDSASLKFGTPGTDLVLTANGTDVVVTSTGDLVFADSVDLAIGTGKDLTITHDGTNTIIDSASATALVALRCGTDTSATSWQIQNNTGTALLTVNGAGTITQADGTTVQRVGAGTGTGDVIERIGATATEGLELVVFDADITPAAVETAVLTVPAGSFVLSVQSNVEVALTGGGTTVTYSLGTTGDPDKYGTPASDALTQNTKSNFMGPFAFLPSAEPIVLTGTATGGAADGDTALTVGTVRVRVVYYTLNSLDNA